MPFQSKSQMRKFGMMVHEGKMSQAEFNKWMSETPSPKSLPERKGRVKRKK